MGRRSGDAWRSEGRWSGERTLAWRLLIAVGLAYLVVQLTVISVSRPPGWDESIYLSQVTPGVDPMAFDAWRARGVTLLVAPVGWLGGSVRDIRLFLMVTSALAMIVAFRIWIPLVGLAAPVAAVLFAFSWLGLLNGSEVMPNLWAAILGVMAAGLIARRLEGGSIRQAALAAAALGAMALVRPTEAAVLAGAIGLYVMVFRTTSWRLLVALGVGLVLGWLPWFVEMSVRFGGPGGAFREATARHFTTTTFADNVFVHLSGTGGQLNASHVPWGGVLWWSLLAALTVVALASSLRRTDRAVAVLACLAALALAAEYLVFVSTLPAPRFLLPAYAFASLPAAIGLLALLRGTAVPRAPGPTASRIAGALVLVLILPWAIWQGIAALEHERLRMVSTVRFRDVGLTIQRLAGGMPCSFLSPHGYPMIEFASGCDGARLQRPRGPTAPELHELVARGKRIFVILKIPPRPELLRRSVPVPVRGPRRTWFIYPIAAPFGGLGA